MPSVFNVGSINIDEVFTVPHFVLPGETLFCSSCSRFPGGKGQNQSVALARAGAPVIHCGKTGFDGRDVLERLSLDGVDVSRIAIGELATGRAIIQVDDSGQNCILLFGGANRDIGEQDIDRFLDGAGSGDMLLLQNEISSVEYALEKGKALNMYVVFNPSPVDENLLMLPLEHADCFILNEIEGALLAGLRPAESPEPETILDALTARFPSTDIALTLGERGSLWAGADGARVAASATRDIPVDTTAAGDTWCGYFLAARLRGEPVGQAMKEASRAAGICISRAGASVSIPFRAEVLARM